MYTNSHIVDLESKAKIAKRNYESSQGKEWVSHVLALKALSYAYSMGNRPKDATTCARKADIILKQEKVNIVASLFDSNTNASLIKYYDKIIYWEHKVGERKSVLGTEDSYLNYAKAVNALCEFLRLAGQSDIALLLYEDALQIIFPKISSNNHDLNEIYITLIMLLQASLCAIESGNITISRKYCVLPLLILAERSELWYNNKIINWDYIIDLSKELIEKI